MPIYEYHCEPCGEDFETLVLSRTEEVTCPKCGGARTRRLMSVFASKVGEKFTPSQGGGSNCSSCASKHCDTCG